MILLLIPVAGLVLGLGLWVGLRRFDALTLGFDGTDRASRRDRRSGGGGFSLRPGSFRSEGVREWADNLPQGCLIGVIAVSVLWILAWLGLLIFGLSLLS